MFILLTGLLLLSLLFSLLLSSFSLLLWLCVLLISLVLLCCLVFLLIAWLLGLRLAIFRILRLGCCLFGVIDSLLQLLLCFVDGCLVFFVVRRQIQKFFCLFRHLLKPVCDQLLQLPGGGFEVVFLDGCNRFFDALLTFRQAIAFFGFGPRLLLLITVDVIFLRVSSFLQFSFRVLRVLLSRLQVLFGQVVCDLLHELLSIRGRFFVRGVRWVWFVLLCFFHHALIFSGEGCLFCSDHLSKLLASLLVCLVFGSVSQLLLLLLKLSRFLRQLFGCVGSPKKLFTFRFRIAFDQFLQPVRNLFLLRSRFVVLHLIGQCVLLAS